MNDSFYKNIICEDITIEILGYLTIEKIINIRSVCKSWNINTHNNLLWYNINEKYFGIEPNSKFNFID